MTERRNVPKTPPKISGPTQYDGWNYLMRQTIERAEILQSRQLPGLLAALAGGRSEQHLRAIGIINVVDIDREFPLVR